MFVAKERMEITGLRIFFSPALKEKNESHKKKDMETIFLN